MITAELSLCWSAREKGPSTNLQSRILTWKTAAASSSKTGKCIKLNTVNLRLICVFFLPVFPFLLRYKTHYSFPLLNKMLSSLNRTPVCGSVLAQRPIKCSIFVDFENKHKLFFSLMALLKAATCHQQRDGMLTLTTVLMGAS